MDSHSTLIIHLLNGKTPVGAEPRQFHTLILAEAGWKVIPF